jgi:hypothetical protein
MKQREIQREVLKREMVKDKGHKNGREKTQRETGWMRQLPNCVFLCFKHSSSQMS